MRPEITQQRMEINRLCRLYGVRRPELFGSALDETFNPATGDIDLVVEFESQIGSGLRRYFGLKADLEALLQRPVDLVELSAMENTRLKRLIQRSKAPVYATMA